MFVALSTSVMMLASVVAPAPAQAQTVESLQAMINQLMAQIAQLSGGAATTGSATPFTRSLTIGSRGADVTQLQNWLIGKGMSVPAGATGYFGAQTKAALAAYQAANGIAPAAGYFGPVTMAHVNAQLSVGTVPPGTVPPTTTMDGTDGSVTVSSSPIVGSGQQIKKGETKDMVAVRLQATSGTVTVNRFDVSFSVRPWLYFSKITLKDSAGNVIATKNLSGASDATEITVGSSYLVRFEGVNTAVTPGTDKVLVVSGSVLAGTDKLTSDTTVSVSVPVGGIRVVNGKGYTDSSQPSTAVTNSVTLLSSGSVADLNTRVSPTSPVKRTIATQVSNITNDVVLGVFGVKTLNNSATLNSLSINLNNSTGAATSTIFSNVRLVDGSTVYGANSLAAGATTFTNLTIPVSQDTWKDLTIMANVAANTTGVSASTTLVKASVVGTDANYNTLTLTNASNQTSQDTVFSTSAVTVTAPTASATNCSATYSNGIIDKCDMTMSFTVTNVGNSDIFISKNPAVALSTSTVAATASSTLTAINIAASANDTSASYAISSGASRTFTYTGTFSKTGGSPATQTFRITAVKFGTVATDAAADTVTAGVGNKVLTSSTNASALIDFGLEPLTISKSL